MKATVRTVEHRRALRRRMFTALVLLIGLPALAYLRRRAVRRLRGRVS